MKKILYLLLVSAAVLSACASKSESSDDTYSPDIEISETIFSQTTDVTAQTSTSNTYESTETTTIFVGTTEPPSEESPEDGQLVRILDYIPDAEIDLRYATENNFTGKVIYDNPEAYLCYGTVKKLVSVQNELKKMGYRILIWDAYRPTEAQWKLWETYPDPTFVADPNNGLTSHSYGNTIDISLVYDDGSPVEMPSGFDEFASIADRDYSDVSENAAANSRILEDVMFRNGFTGYRGEWWDYSDTEKYDIKPVQNGSDNSDSGDRDLTEMLSRGGLTYDDISSSDQMIAVDSDGCGCRVYLYEKNGREWEQISSTNGFVGKNGVTDNKTEGDGCTPSGLYGLGFGFGTEKIDTNIEYRLINDNCYWVDDTDSVRYNQWVESSSITWESAEHLIDYPQSYHYGIVINYNTEPVVVNKGSAIFLHCSTGGYTAGCVAVPEETMTYILQWIDASSDPIILIL